MALTAAERQARYRAKDREVARARGRIYAKNHRAKHPEKVKAALKAWYTANRETIAAQRKAHQALPNREAELATRRARWIRDREKRNEQRRQRRKADIEAARRRDAARRMQPGYSERAVKRTAEWSRKHPEWARALRQQEDAKRRAREIGAFVESIDPRIVFARDKGMCGICQSPVEPMSKWHVDHITPLSKGGKHCYDNVQLAHARCNISKGAKCA